MLKRKRIKEKGKLPFTKFFQNFKEGDSVALVRYPGIKCDVPQRMQGRTGKIISARGKAYVIAVKDINMSKTYIVRPIHLKKIEVQK